MIVLIYYYSEINYKLLFKWESMLIVKNCHKCHINNKKSHIYDSGNNISFTQIYDKI